MSADGTPRQKMIGMMYLVLTALLAMNVSKDILNAFVVVNESLSHTNENFSKKNEKTYADFEGAKAKDPAKTEPYYKRAMEIKKMSEEVNKYIQDLKVHLIMETDKCPEDSAKSWANNLMAVSSKDNYDVPTHIMIGDGLENPKPATEKWAAAELEAKVKKFRDDLINMFGDEKLFLPNTKKEIEGKIGLKLEGGMENGVQTTWAGLNFYHLPLAAVVTNLSKVQSDIKNAEADAINELFKAVKGKDFTFDRLTAKVIAPTSYVFSGEKYTADVLLVAFNSSSSPTILIGDADTTKGGELETNPMKSTKDSLKVVAGMGKYEVQAGGEGIQKWSGCIKVEKPGGGFKYYPFAAEYMVAKPAAAISPTKMNVFYIGVENPVEITAAGVAPENLSPSISGCGGTISGSKGKYTVKVSSAGKTTITVNAKSGGSSKPMGKMEFRCKMLPTPIAKLAGQKGDCTIKKSLIMASSNIVAEMENFDFDLKVPVVSFDVETVVAGDISTVKCTGNILSAAAKQAIEKVKNGGKMYITNVKAKLPDGTTRGLPGLNIKVVL